MAGIDEKLALTLTRRLRAEKFQTAAMIQDETGKTYTLKEQEVFSGASLLKIGIADYVKSVWQEKPAILQQTLSVQPGQRVAGAGVMHHLAQTEWSLRDVVSLMLATSDNTAANILLDHFGRENVDQWLTDNFPGLQLQRNFIAPVVAGKDNFLTAEALLPAWQELFTKENEFTAFCQTALHEQTERGKLVYYAEDLQFTGDTFNKTGDLADVEHDCARLKVGQKWFDCIILTKFNDPEQHQAALELQRDIGKLLMQNLMQK
jgi:Beta-lactamase class A